MCHLFLIHLIFLKKICLNQINQKLGLNKCSEWVWPLTAFSNIPATSQRGKHNYTQLPFGVTNESWCTWTHTTATRSLSCKIYMHKRSAVYRHECDKHSTSMSTNTDKMNSICNAYEPNEDTVCSAAGINLSCHCYIRAHTRMWLTRLHVSWWVCCYVELCYVVCIYSYSYSQKIAMRGIVNVK